MKNQTLMFAIIVVAALTFSALTVLFASSNFKREDENHINNTSPTPTAIPEPKKATAEVIVKPWHGVIDPANGYVEQVNGYSIEVEQ